MANEQTAETVAGQAETPTTQQAPAATPAPAAQAAPAATAAESKVVMLPQSAMKELKEREREKGRKQALADMAKEAGFSSVEEMTKAMAKRKNGGEPVRQTKPSNNTSRPHAPDKNDKELQRLSRERDELAKRMKYETERRKELQQEKEALEAEMSLREAAVQVGVKDIDVAIELLRRDTKGKTEEELRTFDEHKFFAGLRETRPYLFNEVLKPATTGTGAGNPPAPKPEEATQAGAQGSQIDARKMSREEYQNRLASLGLNSSM